MLTFLGRLMEPGSSTIVIESGGSKASLRLNFQHNNAILGQALKTGHTYYYTKSALTFENTLTIYKISSLLEITFENK
jgi:hypothetical protein